MAALCWCAALASAQGIRLFSEFERFDPFGNPAAPDRDFAAREILSPAIARNGHLSVHIVVTAPHGANYFLYVAANPPGLVDLTLYREFFVPCGSGYCPDWITPIPSPSFGAIPEGLPGLEGQSTRCYLLDIHATANTPPRRARVEAQLKAGTWQVAPMEVRIMAPTVPEISSVRHESAVAPVEEPSSTTAQIQMLRQLAGLQPQFPIQILTVRDIIQRNAAEDMLIFASSRNLDSGNADLSNGGGLVPEINLLALSPIRWQVGSEWYLKVRDFLLNRVP